jgi:glycerol-3-phosphate acyltransferase PlsX
MGSAMAGVLFGLDRPTVGLLNIGVEEVKGLEDVREAGRSCAPDNGRSSSISASSRAAISARGRWTWW